MKFLVGLAAYVTAALLVYLVIEDVLSRAAALAAVVACSMLVPVGLTQLVLPAFRRLDPQTTFLGTLVGMAGFCAVVTLVALPLMARAPVARALTDAAARYPQLGPAPREVVRRLSTALVPATDAGVADAGVRDAGVRDAATDVADVVVVADVSDVSDVSDAADATDALDEDAGDVADAVDDGDAGDATDADDAAITANDADEDDATDEDDAAPTRAVFAEVEPCEQPWEVLVGDLEGDARDEIVVQCFQSVVVLAVSEGRLLERVRYLSAAPGELSAYPGRPALFDVNGDGRRDLLLPEKYTSARGGGRGGATWMLPNLGDGRWGTIESFDRMDGAGAAAAGDITGDGQPEILLTYQGNPYDPVNPHGRVGWFSRAGRRWTRRGVFPVDTNPDGIFFADANNDHILDVLVRHDWSGGHPVLTLPGSRTGLRAVDPTLHPAPPSLETRVDANLDGDGHPDAVDVSTHRNVVFWRTQAVEAPLRTVVEVAPTWPPVPRDGGADGGTDAAGDGG